MPVASELIPAETIQQRILVVRGRRVLLDADLARFYEVTTFNLNKAVGRNPERFPEDFAFRLTLDESRALKFQSGISKPGRGGVRKPALVFTEQGVAMLASVLRSPRAVAVSVAIVRAFVRLRELLTGNRELAAKVVQLERTLATHDGAIRELFAAIRQLLAPAPPATGEVGFHTRLLPPPVSNGVKVVKLTHGDLSQLQLYVNYYDREKRAAGDNPTLGLILCTDKNDAVVKYTVGAGQEKTIFASRYKLHLPTEAELKAAVRRELKQLTTRSKSS